MSVYVGESRGELLTWLNELLAPQLLTKVEQCGTGAVYCQIIDSIYGNVPVSKVRFNAKAEYEYLENFKILQKAFSANKIDKPIPTQKLVKCRMQDNLEFLQWMKKFWDQHASGEAYDALGRANGQVQSAPTTSRSASAARPAPGPARVPGGVASRSASATSQAQLAEMREQVAEMEAMGEALHRERDFYFDKLRRIELIVQERSSIADLTEEEKTILGNIQGILYETEEGFELPENGEAPLEADGIGEEETF